MIFFFHRYELPVILEHIRQQSQQPTDVPLLDQTPVQPQQPINEPLPDQTQPHSQQQMPEPVLQSSEAQAASSDVQQSPLPTSRHTLEQLPPACVAVADDSSSVEVLREGPVVSLSSSSWSYSGLDSLTSRSSDTKVNVQCSSEAPAVDGCEKLVSSSADVGSAVCFESHRRGVNCFGNEHPMTLSAQCTMEPFATDTENQQVDEVCSGDGAVRLRKNTGVNDA